MASPSPFGKKRDRKEEFYVERSGSRLPLSFMAL